MAIVSSYGTLAAIANPSPGLVSTVTTSSAFYDGYSRTYGEIYRTQPHVRTVVDFFARNIAQLGLGAFRRVGDTDRQRLIDHPLPRVIRQPNPWTTRYRFIESTVQDLGVYANAYWLKVRTSAQLGLVRLPAAEMSVTGRLLPTGYVWTADGVQPVPFAPSEIVHFRMYDPTNACVGLPPIETLRRVLAEVEAAGDYREAFWKNAGRFETVLLRPAGAPKWPAVGVTREEFRKQWQEFAGARAGQTPILEDGMDLKPVSFNAKDSQYAEGLRLAREFVAAAYHVPLPMVGILEHATFSNIREQHKQLYQDCLGPWLVGLEEEVELQLVPEFDDVEDVYLEFNIAEKMKGSFEEQADSLSKATGRPYMTANEARARLNLPRSDDPSADRLAEASPGQAAPSRPAADTASVAAVVQRHFARQQARVGKVDPDARAGLFAELLPRWDVELAMDLRPLGIAPRRAHDVNQETATLLAAGVEPWPVARTSAVVTALMEVSRD